MLLLLRAGGQGFQLVHRSHEGIEGLSHVALEALVQRRRSCRRRVTPSPPLRLGPEGGVEEPDDGEAEGVEEVDEEQRSGHDEAHHAGGRRRQEEVNSEGERRVGGREDGEG